MKKKPRKPARTKKSSPAVNVIEDSRTVTKRTKINDTTINLEVTRKDEPQIPRTINITLEKDTPQEFGPMTIGDLVRGNLNVPSRPSEQSSRDQDFEINSGKASVRPWWLTAVLPKEKKPHPYPTLRFVPATKWERFKKSFFPAWAKRAWPVKEKSVEVKS